MQASTLIDRVVVVTGSTRGIGFAVAARVVAAGARVAVVGRDARAAADAVARLGGDARALACVGDVADEAFASRALDQVAQRFGGIDALVNNAGVGLFGPVETMATADWQQLVATNLTGPFLWTRAALPHLKRRGGGTIVNVSSLASRNPFAGGAAYAATKAGLNAFTEALLEEVRHDDIRVALVLPGSVDTGFSGRTAGGAPWKVAPADVAEAIAGILTQPARVLASRVELRPSKPPKR